MIKKMMLLAVAAAAVIAFAVPAAASANWTHEGSPLGSDAVVDFSGPASFSIGGGLAGASATIHAEVELTAGTTTAHVLSFVDTNCRGFGQLAGTTCTGTAENLPWLAHIENGEIRITDIKLTNHYYSLLAKDHSEPLTTTVLEGDIVATPNNSEEISSVSLAGDGTTANGNPAAVEGTLGVTPAGTYGIE